MLITGDTDDIPRAALEHAGVWALITTPWDYARLKATLRRAIARVGRFLVYKFVNRAPPSSLEGAWARFPNF
jgi:hypothetical protein